MGLSDREIKASSAKVTTFIQRVESFEYVECNFITFDVNTTQSRVVKTYLKLSTRPIMISWFVWLVDKVNPSTSHQLHIASNEVFGI